MRFASQKYDPINLNCYEKHSYKSELKELKDIRKNKIDEFPKYFSSLKVLEFNHGRITY